ncbi:Peptidyl-prolyl cis-trans isomerase CWC27 like protein [Eufriesea mexicana]|uniref:Peptidyl-prolyl cis-trans isomerase CWC27 like protein n=1 Tax=Eufriesea mexicana TaxID=516756 RepID=A0A310S701_9HYME|nr:Peptidyl-prolyl cis-trans isomerase CWC27 like protein [Eufriesea mexicana]
MDSEEYSNELSRNEVKFPFNPLLKWNSRIQGYFHYRSENDSTNEECSHSPILLDLDKNSKQQQQEILNQEENSSSKLSSINQYLQDQLVRNGPENSSIPRQQCGRRSWQDENFENRQQNNDRVFVIRVPEPEVINTHPHLEILHETNIKSVQREPSQTEKELSTKGFITQDGDSTDRGEGGKIYGEPFKKDDNGSQYFFILSSTPDLQNKRTISGRATGESIYSMLKLEEALVDENDRPLYPPRLIKTIILNNPFPDIIPRIIVQESEFFELEFVKKEKEAMKKRIKDTLRDTKKEPKKEQNYKIDDFEDGKGIKENE